MPLSLLLARRDLGADGRDYRADFVHAPFPKILSSRDALGPFYLARLQQRPHGGRYFASDRLSVADVIRVDPTS